MKHKKLLILLALFIAWIAMFALRVRAEAPEMTPEQKYEFEINAWLDRLEWDESNNKKLLVVLDTNNKYSHGCLQYQMDTWLADSKKYGVKGEMMDCNAQRKLARITVENEPESGWKRWKTSVTTKTAGYPPKKP